MALAFLAASLIAAHIAGFVPNAFVRLWIFNVTLSHDFFSLFMVADVYPMAGIPKSSRGTNVDKERLEKGKQQRWRAKMIFHAASFFRRSFFAVFVFMAAYLTTVTVSATAQTAIVTPLETGGIVVSDNGGANVTGTIIDADEDWVLIDAAGKEIRVSLNEVDLNAESDVVFEKGMMISVQGEMRGEEFGVPLMRAETVRAAQPSTVTIVP